MNVPVLILAAAGLAIASGNKESGGNDTGGNAGINLSPVSGGKNIIDIPNIPILANGLPQALHVYSADFPLEEGDKGNVITILQHMLNLRYKKNIPLTGVFDDATANAMAGLTGVWLDYNQLNPVTWIYNFNGIATASPALVGLIKVYDFKPE